MYNIKIINTILSEVVVLDENKKDSADIIPRRKQEKKRSKFKKTFLSIFLALIFILISGTGYLYFTLSKVKTTKIDTSNKAVGIDPNVENKIKQISNPPINIALFGTDSRNLNENGNSDTIMIATIDKDHKKIKLTSIMRDSRVDIPGYGLYKINAAYLMGGPQLAVKTINSVYGLNIKSYVTVNFFGMATIIDGLGGVDINVQQDEIKQLNDLQGEVANIEKIAPVLVTHAGLQHLNGLQALGYSRIRKVGNNDQQRTERQRTVLTLIINKIMAGGILSYPSTVNKLLPYVQTSISTGDLLSYGSDAIQAGIKNIVQERFPLDSYMSTPNINGVDYVIFDLDATKQQLYDFIFNDITPQEKK